MTCAEKFGEKRDAGRRVGRGIGRGAGSGAGRGVGRGVGRGAGRGVGRGAGRGAGRRWVKIAVSAAMALVLISICSRSSPFYPFNNSTDANIFFTVGKSMMRGLVPYRDVYEQKGPLVYLLYGVAYLVSNASFFGVFLLEAAAFAALSFFMVSIIAEYAGSRLGCANPRIAEACHEAAGRDAPGCDGTQPAAYFAAPRRVHYILTFAAGALIASSRGFALGGGSVEELALPAMAFSLYSLLRAARGGFGRTARGGFGRAAPELTLVNGVLCGCVFWMKYTLCGFYAGYAVVLLLITFKSGGARSALSALSRFAAGFFLAALPWLTYFALHGALRDLYEAYFYNNIVQYSIIGAEAGGVFTALFSGLKKSILDNPWVFAPAFAGIAYALASRRFRRYEKYAVAATSALLLISTHTGGRVQAYTPLIFGLYTVFGAIAVLRAFEWARARMKKSYKFAGVGRGIPDAPHDRGVHMDTPSHPTKRMTAAGGWISACVFSALIVAFAYNYSYNTYFFGKPKDTMPQFHFASAMREKSGDPTLLNYGFMDGGFYTATHIVPNVKYYCTYNVLPDVVAAEQSGYLAAGLTEFAVTMDEPLDLEKYQRYTPLDEKTFYSRSYASTYYLYQRK